MAQVARPDDGSALVVMPMQQLEHAKVPEDDWTGLKDRAERKKRQTRLNVSAHPEEPSEHLAGFLGIPRGLPTIYPPRLPVGTISLPTPTVHNIGHSSFPLSSDHLITLIEYNVYRASLTNNHILSHFNLLRNAACEYLLDPEPPLFPRAAPYSCVPEALQPTELQRTTPHELWIDILPSSVMRDNAIRAVEEGRLHQGEMCADLLKEMCAGAKGPLGEASRAALQRRHESVEGEEDARMIVWTNPWEISGWEATPGFVRKYGYLLHGRKDFLQSTNKWREMRDEPFTWE